MKIFSRVGGFALILLFAGLAVRCTARSYLRFGNTTVVVNTPAQLCAKIAGEDCNNYMESFSSDQASYGEDVCTYLKSETQNCVAKVSSPDLFECYKNGYLDCSPQATKGDLWLYCLGATDENCANPNDTDLAESLCNQFVEQCNVTAKSFPDPKDNEQRQSDCDDIAADIPHCVEGARPHLKCWVDGLQLAEPFASADPVNWDSTFFDYLETCGDQQDAKEAEKHKGDDAGKDNPESTGTASVGDGETKAADTNDANSDSSEHPESASTSDTSDAPSSSLRRSANDDDDESL